MKNSDMKVLLVSFGILVMVAIIGCGGTTVIGDYQEGFLHIISGRFSGGGNTVTPFSVDPEAGTLTQLSAELSPSWSVGLQIADVDSLGDGNIILLEAYGREFMSIVVDLDTGLVSEAGNRQTISFGNTPSQLHYDNGVVIINEAGGAAAGNELAVYLFDRTARTFTEAAGSPINTGNIHPASGLFVDGHFFIGTDANVIGIGDPVGLRHYTVSATGQLTQVGQVDLDTTDANAITGFRFYYETNILLVVVYYNAQAPSVNLIQIDGAGAMTRLSSMTLNNAGRLGGEILKVGDRYLIGETMASSAINVIEVQGGNTLVAATGSPFTLSQVNNIRLDDAFGNYVYFSQYDNNINLPSFRSMEVTSTTLTNVSQVLHPGWTSISGFTSRQGKLFAISEGNGGSDAQVIKADLNDGTLEYVGNYGMPGQGPYYTVFTLKP